MTLIVKKNKTIYQSINIECSNPVLCDTKYLYDLNFKIKYKSMMKTYSLCIVNYNNYFCIYLFYAFMVKN